MARAVDAMYTFSTADWMVTPRHRGKWPCRTLDDLLARVDSDPVLSNRESRHIILAHDQDDLLPVFRATVGHLLDKGFAFTKGL
jgi:hypothetical protein